MQVRLSGGRNFSLPAAVLVVAAIYGLYRLRASLIPLAGIALGGVALAFLLEPVYELFLKRLPPAAAALGALVSVGAGLAGLIWLLVPALAREGRELGAVLPGSLRALSDVLSGAADRLRAHGFLLPDHLPDLAPLSGQLLRLAQRSAGAAQRFAAGLGNLALMAVLCYFILADRERFLLRAELLVPLRFRALAVRMAAAVKRELRLFLRAQGTIAAAVGLLSWLALRLAGVRSALVLGLFVGLFNMIPYLGPVIGAIPALIVALGSGYMTVLWAGVGLFLVQQIDGSLLSPRIMSAVTGMDPAAVLLAVYAGGRIAGAAGMLFALPALVSLRACAEVYAQARADHFLPDV